MRNRTFADLDRVVALGGLVTTTDNGGSTGLIRRAESGIARGFLNQLRTEPSVVSAMF